MVKSEAVLVEEARAGSRDAFSELLRIHQAHVRAFLSRYSQNDDSVDDLAQETFLTAYNDLSSYRGDSSLRTWLLGIARHRALRYLEDLKGRRLRETTTLRSWLASGLSRRAQAEPSAVVRHDEELSALDRCLQSLPEKGSNLIEGFYFERRSSSDLARLMGQSESAVRMTLLRVRQALRRCIQLRLAAAGSSRE